jgi:hypothetical protein
MKIQAVRHYPAFDYPALSAVQQHPSLLKNVPARWEKSSGFAALLGLLALTISSRAEAIRVEAPAQGPAEVLPDAQTNPRRITNAVERALAVVAPLLEEALEHDGRGSFGCISICPATFMPEDEALDLIRTELEAAGLQLKEGVELENVPAPIREPLEARQSKGQDGEISLELLRAWGEDSAVGPRPVRFDWADPKRAIYIDYLTKRDYRAWKTRMVSTADYFDFPELAQQVSAAYADYQADQKTIFGVFFEPLADSGVMELDLYGLTPEQARIASLEHEKKRETVKGEKSRERLRAQVRNFVEFLRKEGVVAGTK